MKIVKLPSTYYIIIESLDEVNNFIKNPKELIKEFHFISENDEDIDETLVESLSGYTDYKEEDFPITIKLCSKSYEMHSYDYDMKQIINQIDINYFEDSDIDTCIQDIMMWINDLIDSLKRMNIDFKLEK